METCKHGSGAGSRKPTAEMRQGVECRAYNIQNGIYCSFPHAVELLNKPYSDLFTILTSYPELENYLSPFMDAWKGGAQDQLQGQIASAKIPLTRMISPQLYWVMTGNDFLWTSIIRKNLKSFVWAIIRTDRTSIPLRSDCIIPESSN